MVFRSAVAANNALGSSANRCKPHQIKEIKMATFLELETQYTRKRDLYYGLISGIPMTRLRQLIDAIPYDKDPPTRK